MPNRRDHQPKKSSRLFVGRTDPINIFWNKFDYMMDQDYSVISFYGIGGIGKTRLKRELIKRVISSPWSKYTVISSVLDFDTRDNQPSLRDMERALYALRNELQKKGIHFRAFDIAYAHYWEQNHPEVALQQKDVPFINEGSALLDLFSGAKDLAESLKDFATWIVGAGMLPKALTLINAIHKAGKEWLSKRAIEKLQQIDNLHSGQLLQELLYFLAYDIRTYQESQPTQRLVFFLDTYEALWWDAPQNRSKEHWLVRDKWIRDLVAELPHALWIIGGRNSLRWQEISDWKQVVKEIKLDELSDSDSELFLVEAGINSDAVREKIKQSSQGVPFALELQIDQYERINQTRDPIVNDFADREDELIQRFTEYLTLQELQTLKVLSVTRVWDWTLFRALIREFQTGYPATAITELGYFSFISKQREYYRMHSLMRDELQNGLETLQLEECHRFLSAYYDKQINSLDFKHITTNQEFALGEAFYHKLNSEHLEYVTEWLLAHLEVFKLGSRWTVSLRISQEILAYWEKQQNYTSSIFYSQVLSEIGLIYTGIGHYELSISYFKRALAIQQMLLEKEQFNIAPLLNNIGTVYSKQGNYEKALEYYQQALAIQQALLGNQHPETAIALNNLGTVYYNQGDYENALKSYQQALFIQQTVFIDQEHAIAITLNHIGLVCSQQGEFEKAMESYQQALVIDQALLGDKHPDTASLLNNIGGLYYRKGDYEKASEHYQRALTIQRILLGDQHPDTAISLNNIALVHQHQGEYEKALEYFQQALVIIEALLGDLHPTKATLIHNIGLVYQRQGNIEKALEHFQQALLIQRNLLGDQHPSTASSLNSIGVIYYYQDEYEQALNCFKQAFVVRYALFGEQHFSTIDSKNWIDEMNSILGQD